MSFFKRIWDKAVDGSKAVWKGLTNAVGLGGLSGGSSSGGSTASTQGKWSWLAPIAGAGLDAIIGKGSAKDQMRFQAEMASSQHQREVADLRKAGLNPILSGTGGAGAAAPSGAGYDSDFGQAASAAAMMRAQTRLLESQAENLDQSTRNANQEYHLTREFGPLERQASLWEQKTRIKKIVQETGNSAKDLEIKTKRFQRELDDPELQQWIISEGYATQKQIDRMLSKDANWSDVAPMALKILSILK